MNTETIEKMKRTKRLKLIGWQIFEHYSILAYFFLVLGYKFHSLFEIYITKSYDGVQTADEIISDCCPWAILIIIFSIIQRRRLRFKEIKIEYSNEEFYEASKRTAKQFNWQIKKNNENYFQAIRSNVISNYWGEMITIIKDKDKLLLNSICDPNKIGSVISYGWNTKNINTFLKHLSDIKKGIPMQKWE